MRETNAEYLGAAMCGLAGDFSDFMSKASAAVGQVSNVVKAAQPGLSTASGFINQIQAGRVQQPQQLQPFAPFGQIASSIGPAKNYLIPLGLLAAAGLVVFVMHKKKGKKS